ncbi:MAG: hypothetical protein INF43_00780 [Alphaproteobacteria bacterium]|jgi:hypothetical protein|nr:hypothetical protein [Alphaproteobacteria bacterium]
MLFAPLTPDAVHAAAMRYLDVAHQLRLFTPGPLTELLILGWGWQFEVLARLASFGQPLPDYGLGRSPTVCG